MTFQILRKNPITFYQHDGIKLFKEIEAVDKFKKPLKISLESDSSIIAKDTYNSDISLYEINFDREKKEAEGLSLVANPKKKGIGEVLNLASLIIFNENKFNLFKVFSLRDSIPFYAKFGFNIRSKNPDEVLHNLKFVTKEKDGKYFDSANSAKFFFSKMKDPQNRGDNFELANNVVGDYLRSKIRNGEKIDSDDLYNHAHMEFSALDTVKNREYLNEMLEKHEINYQV